MPLSFLIRLRFSLSDASLPSITMQVISGFLNTKTPASIRKTIKIKEPLRALPVSMRSRKQNLQLIKLCILQALSRISLYSRVSFILVFLQAEKRAYPLEQVLAGRDCSAVVPA